MKVLVTPRSFGKTDPGLFTRLAVAGLEIVRNETGAILNQESMCRLIAPCSGVILGVDPLGAEVLAHAPLLKAISKYGVGLDNIDLEACKKRGIKVSRAVGANSDAVADYAFALMLAVARRVVQIDRRCHERDWSKVTTSDVYGKTLGIIGLGAIGQRVARRARGFEMRILAADPHWNAEFASQLGVARADIDKICAEADFITLHCNLDENSKNIIGARELGLMKKSAILVNTSRGGLIDEAALLDALKNERIYGAGLDVFENEPPENPEWYELNNLVMGSHCSASTKNAVERMGSMAVDNLLRDLELAF